jgi:hypothetical protein
MRRPIAGIIGMLVTPLAFAQPPSAAKPSMVRPLYSEIQDENARLRPMETVSVGKRPDPLRFDAPTVFDPATLRLKREAGQWQLWAGTQLLKDFGPAEADAHEVLRLFRDLRLNARGSVGGVFEYFLSDNKAPSAALRSKEVVPFDLATLRVEQINGQWVLRDPRIILYNFGLSQNDAKQALAICRQYGFNQIGIVGHPTPTLKYLLKDPNPPLSFKDRQPIVPVSAQMQASEPTRRQLYVPGTGAVGSVTSFNYRQLDLHRDAGEFVLFHGKTVMARFGAQEQVARTALELLQQFRCTELCEFGPGGFGFYLSNGRPPQGSLVGVQSRPIRFDRWSVRKIGGAWSICEDLRPLFQFGDEESTARQALAAIRHFQFDSYCPVGGGHLGDAYLFVRMR